MENIAAGLKARHVYRQKKARVAEFLKLVGLQDLAGAYPHQISGGMAQRATITHSLINDPEVLLLDEPMGALDSFSRANLQDKLLELQRVSETTMILVTQDIDKAVYLSDRIAIMTPRPGRISEVVTVSTEKPRQRSSQAFTTLRGELLVNFICKPIVTARIYHLEMREKHSNLIAFERGLGMPRLTHAPNPRFEFAYFL